MCCGPHWSLPPCPPTPLPVLPTTGDTWKQRTHTASNRTHLSYHQAQVSHARVLLTQSVLARGRAPCSTAVSVLRWGTLNFRSAGWLLSLPTSCCSLCPLLASNGVRVSVALRFPCLCLSIAFHPSFLVCSSCVVFSAFLPWLAGMWGYNVCMQNLGNAVWSAVLCRHGVAALLSPSASSFPCESIMVCSHGLIPPGTSVSLSDCDVAVWADHSHSSQRQWFHQIHCSALQKRPRTGSPLCSASSTRLTYFWWKPH